MPSPFPGMDPYLEDGQFWPIFQHQLVTGLYQVLLPGLVDRYRARVGQRTYFTEQALFTSIVRDDHLEEFIEIRQRTDGKLITLIDVVSPSNRMTEPGRQAYLARRRDARNGGANLVEIDLVLQGDSLIDYSREGLPEWDYAVTVTRATQMDRREIYTSTVQKRLPRFRLPLAGDDRDTVVDLQTSIQRAYEHGGFGSKIDYQKSPLAKLSPENLKWVDELLKHHKLR